jgi:hypothetical protein
MKPEKQRIAIAEACGWTYGNFNWFLNGENQDVVSCPDYLHDLNAMHEVERQLMQAQPHLRKSYRNALIDASGDSADTFQRYWMATAAQRAEAFLKTLNLWKP